MEYERSDRDRLKDLGSCVRDTSASRIFRYAQSTQSRNQPLVSDGANNIFSGARSSNRFSVFLRKQTEVPGGITPIRTPLITPPLKLLPRLPRIHLHFSCKLLSLVVFQ